MEVNRKSFSPLAKEIEGSSALELPDRMVDVVVDGSISDIEEATSNSEASGSNTEAEEQRPIFAGVVPSKFSSLYQDSPAARLDRSTIDTPSPRQASRYYWKRNCIAILFLSSIGALALSCIILLQVLSNEKEQTETTSHLTFMSSISLSGLQETLQFYTQKSRRAGSEQEFEMAYYLHEKALEFGFKSEMIEMHEAQVLLNTPVKISLSSSDETIVYSETENIPFHKFSKNASVSGVIRYANYGRKEDFEYLNTTSHFNNSIVLLRVGKIPLSTKVLNAQMNGAIGVVTYSDPADDEFKGLPPRPLEAVQTSFITSNDDVMIPSIPVSGNAALNILKTLSSESDVNLLLPNDWKGGFDNVSYSSTSASSTVYTLENIMSYDLKTIRNVVITIDGTDERDRFILVGNTRDSTTGGAAFPGSSVAIFTELLRGSAELVKGGWKPRRSIVFGSWGAEEYGNIGSKSWLKDHEAVVENRGVAYLDTSAIGGVLGGTSTLAEFKASVTSSSVSSVVVESTKVVDQPSHDNDDDDIIAKTVYQNGWDDTKTTSTTSSFKTLPTISVGYDGPWESLRNSAYDTYELYHEQCDPSSEYQRTIAQVWSNIILTFAERPLLPIEYVTTGLEMQAAAIVELNTSSVRSRLREAVDSFVKAANATKDQVDSLSLELDALSLKDGGVDDAVDLLLNIRRVNDRLLDTQRTLASLDGWEDIDDEQQEYVRKSECIEQAAGVLAPP